MQLVASMENLFIVFMRRKKNLFFFIATLFLHLREKSVDFLPQVPTNLARVPSPPPPTCSLGKDCICSFTSGSKIAWSSPRAKAFLNFFLMAAWSCPVSSLIPKDQDADVVSNSSGFNRKELALPSSRLN